MPRVFVTGGSGFVGAHLLQTLVERHDQVTCLSRSPPVQCHAVDGVRWIQADLHDAAAYAPAVADAEYVIHLAGLLHARRTAEYLHTNVEGTRVLLNACERAGHSIRCFLHMSSIAAMGPSDDGSLLTETTVCRPRTEYGASKLEAEHLVARTEAVRNRVILRPSFVYGFGDLRCAKFLRDSLRPRPSASRHSVITMSFCHVSDLVRACLFALDREPETRCLTYLIAEPTAYTWQDVDAVLERALLGRVAADNRLLASRLLADLRKAQSMTPANRKGEHWGCSTSVAATDLGFRSVRSLGEAAEEVVRSYIIDGNLFPEMEETVPREV